MIWAALAILALLGLANLAIIITLAYLYAEGE